MNFIIIFGPPAVGKMAVGYALSEITGFKLFHNHVTVELVLNFFPYGHPQFSPLVEQLRQYILKEVAVSELPGVIFTGMWNLENPGSKDKFDSYAAIFRQQGGEIYYVELEASLEERIERNKSAFRLEQKASKRDIAGSEKFLLDTNQLYKFNSNNDFFYQENYIKINNTALSPQETAYRIVEMFGFPTTSVS